MPKTGLSDSQWRQRLYLFGQGKFEFGRGHRPRKGSDRAQELERVEKCPKHRNSVNVDPFGREIQCCCGYHQPKVSEVLNYALRYIEHSFHTSATYTIHTYVQSTIRTSGTRGHISSSHVTFANQSAATVSTVSAVASATEQSTQCALVAAQVQV